MLWFLNTRSQPTGGDVGPVKVTDGTFTYLTCPSDLMSAVRGRDVLIGAHGFNVHQLGAIDHLTEWNKMLQLGGSGVFIGALWPGDSWLGAMEYAFAAKSAMQAGDELAKFINENFSGALSLSFVSHSLGARVVLQTIRRLAPFFTVRRLVMMAPAVDDDCLTKEFSDAAQRAKDISILASNCDDVLKMAFPLGNPISGIFAEGHPFWHAALGREGPKADPLPNNIRTSWHIPDSWKVGHGDYLPPALPYPPGYQPASFTVPLDMPAANAGAPADGTPPVFRIGSDWKYWQCSWTAGLMSSRFR